MTSSNQLSTTSLNPALDQAIAFLTTSGVTPPAPKAVVEALLKAEKMAKQDKVRYAYEQLLGTWRLGFITGTQRSRQRAGVMLGSGRFVPSWVKIELSYSQSESDTDRGTVQNSVKFGPLQLVLTGPIQFWHKMNKLAFDFTRMQVSLFGLTLYNGYIRQGQKREAHFYEQSIKEQAFFTYFLVEERFLAARGRGGGLAMWTK